MDPREKNILAYEQAIQIIRELLKIGDWETSLFLRTAQKKLQNLIDEAEHMLDELQQKKLLAKDEFGERERQGYIRIYVSIYQSDPNNLTKWQTTLNNITPYSVTRPIYRTEADIEAMIRAKNSPNEAYATVLIKQADLLPAYTGKPIADKFGHELLTVREGSILATNIVEFIHLEKTYTLKKGKLTLK